jgi:GWxTD domain-containing protein
LTRREVIALLFISCIFCISYRQGLGQETSKSARVGREPLSRWSREWLDEVVPYIITSAEKNTFLSLRTEKLRGKFIESFWRKRDPDPRTPENEFKLEYYRRVALANKFFGAAGIAGWRTERGRIFILLGPPSEIQRDMTPSATSFPMFRGPKETWNYWGLANPGLPYNLEFTFVDRTGTGHYVLDQSLSLGDQENRPFDLSSISYHFDRLEYLAEATRNPFENLERLRGTTTTQVSYDLIPLRAEHLFLRGPKNTTYVPLVVSLPRSSVSGKTIEERSYYSLSLLINVKDKLGRLAFEKSKDFNFKLAPGEAAGGEDTPLDLRYSILLEPAPYQLHLLVLENFSGKIGTLQQEISVPDFAGDELNLSDIMLSPRGGEESAMDKAEEEKRGLGGKQGFPEFSRAFRPDDELNIDFEIYNLSLSAQTGLNAFRVEYFFFQGETMLTHVPSSKSEETAERDCRVRTTLRLKDFKPGRYFLRVKAQDAHSGKTASKEAEFSVTL